MLSRKLFLLCAAAVLGTRAMDQASTETLQRLEDMMTDRGRGQVKGLCNDGASICIQGFKYAEEPNGDPRIGTHMYKSTVTGSNYSLTEYIKNDTTATCTESSTGTGDRIITYDPNQPTFEALKCDFMAHLPAISRRNSR